jgi:hypothetical protein
MLNAKNKICTEVKTKQIERMAVTSSTIAKTDIPENLKKDLTSKAIQGKLVATSLATNLTQDK